MTRLVEAWEAAGGTLEFGSGRDTTSCFLMLRRNGRDWWPLTVLPGQRIEVVFRHLASRPPFDVESMRRGLLDRLNGAPGIEIPEAKLDGRPSFAAEVLADERAFVAVSDAVKWFANTALSAQGTEPGAHERFWSGYLAHDAGASPIDSTGRVVPKDNWIH